MGLGFSFPVDRLRFSPPMELTEDDLLESGVRDLEGLAVVVDGGTLILAPAAPPRSLSRRSGAAVDIFVFFKVFLEKKKVKTAKGF